MPVSSKETICPPVASTHLAWMIQRREPCTCLPHFSCQALEVVLVGALHLLLALGARDVPERLAVRLDVRDAAAHAEVVGLPAVEAERLLVDLVVDALRVPAGAAAARAGDRERLEVGLPCDCHQPLRSCASGRSGCSSRSLSVSDFWFHAPTLAPLAATVQSTGQFSCALSPKTVPSIVTPLWSAKVSTRLVVSPPFLLVKVTTSPALTRIVSTSTFVSSGACSIDAIVVNL